MPANAAASKVASLQNRMTMPFEEWIKQLEIGDWKKEIVEKRIEEQRKLRKHIDEEFIDINEYMLNLIVSSQK